MARSSIITVLAGRSVSLKRDQRKVVMRQLKTPEAYVSFEDGAKVLRQMADDLEKRATTDRMVSIGVNFWFAETERVEASMNKKFSKSKDIDI